MTNNLRDIQSGIATGNETMLAELYKTFYNRLHHFSGAITRSGQIAEEVVDDVFVKLWNSRNKIGEIENLTVYLYVAVKNQSLNMLSRKANELITKPFDFIEIDLKDTSVNADELMITKEIFQRMQKAVEALPPRCRMIFKLVREDGLKYKEVAQILNIAVNTIDVQMAIAVKRICNALNLEKSGKNYRVTYPEKNF